MLAQGDAMTERKRTFDLGDGETYAEPRAENQAEPPSPLPGRTISKSPETIKWRRGIKYLWLLTLLIPAAAGVVLYRSATVIDFSDPRPYYWWTENWTDKYQMIRAYMGWGPFEDEYKQCLATNAARGVALGAAQGYCVERNTVPGWCTSSSVDGSMAMSSDEWRLTGTYSNGSNSKTIGPRSPNWHCSMDYQPKIILREEFYRISKAGDELGAYYSYTRIAPGETKSIVADRVNIVSHNAKLDSNSEYERIRVVLAPMPK